MIGPGRVVDAVTAVRNIWPHRGAQAQGLPPGQGLARTFPRFGVHFADPIPAVPPQPSIEVRGAVATPFDLPVAALQDLPRRTLVADFHCVAGWSFRDLRWEGVPFRTIWEDSILPNAKPHSEITHLVFVGLDGYKSALTIEDALADEALIADRLDGAPLTGDHGAPARLVSPKQYGYMNTKHLFRIELHTREPAGAWHPSRVRAFGLSLVAPHPRARVELEERHRYLPAWSIRWGYRRLLLPLFALLMAPATLRGPEDSVVVEDTAERDAES
jgi:DMSO/TMAO reductase YedYZ molybdopterin-dependent catalytic subunit